MTVFPTRLVRVATNESVNANLHTELELDALYDAEAIWAPARIRVVQKLVQQGIPAASRPQSLHWNWAAKAGELTPADVGPLGRCRVFGIDAESRWQGMLLGTLLGHPTRTAPAGRDQVYVQYVEVAPWNWPLPSIGQEAVFKGVGRQLVEMAIRWSASEGYRGRIALHALPQAEVFYRDRCGMTDLGQDRSYGGLRYFEMTDAQATAFLGGEKV